MGTGSYLAGLAATSGTTGATTQVDVQQCHVHSVGQPAAWGVRDRVYLQRRWHRHPARQPGLPDPQQGGSTSGTWNILAGGSDIWATYDDFRFISQSFPQDPANSPNGDGTISARVVSQATPNDPWKKTGVMIRSGPSTDPQAPYYGGVRTPATESPSSGAQPRPAIQSGLGLGYGNHPDLGEASRYTDTAHNVVYYSAYTSTDGVTFTFVPGSTVALNLPGPLLAGIGTDSHNSTTSRL